MKQQIDTFFDAEYESRSKDISYLQRDLIPEYATRKKNLILSNSKVVKALLEKMLPGEVYRSLELVEMAGVNFAVKQKLERDERFIQVGRGQWRLK